MIKVLLLWALFSSLSFALTLQDAIDRAMINNPLMKQHNETYKAAQANSLATGSSFAPSLDLAYDYSAYSIANYVGATAASSASATISYNLFNGFQDSANYKSAKAKELSQFYQKQAAKEDLKLRVAKAYINYLRRIKEIDIAEDSVELLQKQYKDAKNFQEQGVFAKNEALQVHVELLTVQRILLSAKRNVSLSRLTLKRELGGVLDDSEEIQGVQRSSKVFDYGQLLAMLYEKRSELKSLQFQKKDLEFQKDAINSEYLPAVDVELKYQVAGNDFIPDGGLSFLRNDETSYGLSMSWNLYQGGKTQYQKRKFLHQSLALSEGIKNIKLQLQLQLSQATQTYELASQQIKVAKLSLRQAKENYRIVNNQFKASIANTTLLLEAQKLLTKAKVSFHEAYFASYDAMAEIERIVEKPIFK